MRPEEMERVGGRPARVDRMLSLFATVHAGEGGTALLLMLNVFTLLTAYYIIKPVREALILGEAGAEIKSYASAGQAALFLLIIPMYGIWASKVSRLWLINGVTAFFISNLAVFFVLGQMGLSLGVVFYLWVGLFNLMLVAQFWAFANDLYTESDGKRLFGVLGIGASLGAILGAFLAGRMFKPLGPYPMMLISGALLGLAMILTNWIHVREKHRAAGRAGHQAGMEGEALGAAGGFQLVFKSRYLLLIAFLVLISNCVNTTGEFILGKAVAESAHSAAAGATDQVAVEKTLIGQFYSDFFFWVNLLGAVMQMFIVSRILQYWGPRAALLVLPIIAFGGYAMLAAAPILTYIRVAKIAENTVDYSLQNTARHALFLGTSRGEKYKAKSAIDTFWWRAGDTVSGILVFTGTQLAIGTRTFAAINVALVLAWLAIVIAIVRFKEQRTTAAHMAA